MNLNPLPEVICGECGSPMVLRSSPRYLYQDGTPKPFYGCSAFPACFSTHGAHPDGHPLGIPGNRATKDARIRAHAVFDAHWKRLGIGRKQGYKIIRDLMGMTTKQAHIGKFDIAQCEELIRRIEGSTADQPSTQPENAPCPA